MSSSPISRRRFRFLLVGSVTLILLPFAGVVMSKLGYGIGLYLFPLLPVGWLMLAYLSGYRKGEREARCFADAAGTNATVASFRKADGVPCGWWLIGCFVYGAALGFAMGDEPHVGEGRLYAAFIGGLIWLIVSLPFVIIAFLLYQLGRRRGYAALGPASSTTSS